MNSNHPPSSTRKALVVHIFRKEFGTDPEADDLFVLLQTYKGAEPARVHLAILKLSGGDPEKLQHNIEAAKIDYRDVLAWAEYPEQMNTGASSFNSSSEVIAAIRTRDRDQYQAWLSENEDH